MAPVTRRSQQSNGVKSGSKVPARKPRTNSNRDTTDYPQQIKAGSIFDEDDDAGDKVPERGVQPVDVEDALNPLREMADKIGREVETFAEDLDKFLDQLTNRNKFTTALELVDSFKAVAHDAAANLQESHRKERAQQLREEWRAGTGISAASNALTPFTEEPRSNLSGLKRKQVRELRSWQQEADIWDLFRIVLENHHNPDKQSQQQDRDRELAALGQPHRYTTEGELWSRFLIDNDLARERAKIKTWLEQAADHQDSDLPNIVEELESKAGRGKGLWSHGLMHTREQIKHEKRLRPWSSTADTQLPQIKRSDSKELLTSQLDPDAATRQDRTIEKADAYFDRAMWIACWEMLRRGTPWDEVSQWCEQRKESWRAASIGKAADSSAVFSNFAWRKSCLVASRAGCSSDYEAAVYGLLGGNASAMQKVCTTVDEQLYAYYSAALTNQFDQYLTSNFPERTQHQAQIITDDDLRNPQDAITELIVRLRSKKETSLESGHPIKIVQSYLIANEADSLIHTIGFALAEADKLNKKKADEDMMVHLGQIDIIPESEAAVDPQVLRISAHISIILNVLSSTMLDGDERDAEENVLVAYIQTLRAARKRDLIPLYASRLQVARYVVAISRVMQDITDVREQEQTLNLLEHYGLDIIMILREQQAFLLNRLLAKSPASEKPLTLLETTEISPLYPGTRIIQDVLPTEFTDDDMAVVRSLKWFYIMHGRWNDTFQALSLALRQCLITGRIASALLIIEEFPYETVSIRKSYQVIGKSINMMDYDGPAPNDEEPTWSLLKRQSRTYYELELLLTAIQALAIWREKESDYTQKTPKLTSAPPALRAAKDAVDAAMVPILDGLLQNPLNDEEASDLEKIRTAYIPEIVLAYNTVLHSAGSLISRDNLIESMDLSTTIARDGSYIAECFVRAKRMRELVTSFAETSKAMLILKEAGRPWRSKKDKEGKDLGLWEIGPQSHQIGELGNGEPRRITVD